MSPVPRYDILFHSPCIKQVGRRPEILREAAGKALKVIAPLLARLPARHRYKVIYMDRPIAEVVASQQRMLANRGRSGGADPETMSRLLTTFRESTLRLLDRAPQFEPLIVDYPDLVRNPAEWLERIARFVGCADPAAMAQAIRPELHRNR